MFWHGNNSMTRIVTILISVAVSPLLLYCEQSYGFEEKVSPEELVSDQCVMLVKITDTERTFRNLYDRIYVPFYSQAVEAERLGPLDVPSVQHFVNPKGISGRHCLWRNLSGIGDSIPLVAMILDDLQGVSADKTLVNSAADDVVGQIAEIFSGEAFVAVEKAEDSFRVVFGFEFEKEVLNWSKVLEETAARQNSSAKPSFYELGLPIFHLPSENIYFFTHENMLYGVCDLTADYCRKIVRRVKKDASQDYLSCKNSRSFRRVETNLIGPKRSKYDIFCYANYEKMFDISKLKTLKESLDCFRTFGAVINFGEENLVEYRICNPIIQPLPDYSIEAFKHLEDLDQSKVRKLPSFASWAVYLSHGSSAFFKDYEAICQVPGEELAMGFWKDACSAKHSTRPTGNQLSVFGQSIENALSGDEQLTEVCKFAAIIAGGGMYLDELEGGFDVLRGVIVDAADIDQDSAIGMSSKKLEGKSPFNFEMEGEREESEFENANVAHNSSEHHQEFAIHRYGRRGADGFSIFDYGDYLAVVSDVGFMGLLDRELTRQTCQTFEELEFGVQETFEFNTAGKHLKAISAKQNFFTNNVEASQFAKIFSFIGWCQRRHHTSSNYRAKVLGDSNVYYENIIPRIQDVSLLSRLIDIPLSLFDKRLNTVTHLNVMPLQNMNLVVLEFMFDSTNDGAIEYLGCLRTRRSNK